MSLIPFPVSNGKNHPGYIEVFLCAKEDVSSIPAATNGDVASAIQMETAKVFTPFPLDEEVGGFLSIEEPEAEGSTGYMYTVSLFYRGNSAAARSALDTLDGVYLVIIGRRPDGVLEIIGDPQRGIRLRINKEDAGKAGNRVGNLLQGSMDFTHLPYTYSDGTIAL